MSMTRIVIWLWIIICLATLVGVGMSYAHKAKVEARGVEMKKRMQETGDLYCFNQEAMC